MFDENKLKEIILRECAKNKSSKITSISKCNVDDPKNIYASVIGICTLSTYSSLINDESLNNALNKVVNLAKDNESFKNHLSSFTPQIWLSISSSAELHAREPQQIWEMLKAQVEVYSYV